MSQPVEGKSLETYQLFRDPQKHYVRVYGWVAVALRRLQKVGKHREFGLRYMTLCGQDAIDIFLFKREGLIRDDGRGFPSVYYIENYYNSFAKARFFLGRTPGKMISFEDLVNQGWFERLIGEQPFDVINLDFSGSCFPKTDHPFSRTLRAINRIIELQRGNDYDLFVTFKALRSMENSDAINELAANMAQNFLKYPEVEEAFERYFPTLNPTQLSEADYGRFLLVTFPKIVFGFGANNGFNVSCNMKFVYERRPAGKPSYQIVKFLFSFAKIVAESFSKESRLHQTSTVAYDASVVQDLNIAPIDVDQRISDETSLEKTLESDLRTVLALRTPLGE
jgi:hypothetical protein